MKDVCRRSEIRPQAVFGPSALQAVQDHRNAFITVMSSTMTDFAKVVASAVRPPRQYQQNARMCGGRGARGHQQQQHQHQQRQFQQDQPRGRGAFRGRARSQETWTRSAAVGVNHACSGYLHSGFPTFP